MGEISESLINGEFDYITGEYIGEPTGYPRTLDSDCGNKPNWKKYNQCKKIRKELKELIELKQAVCTTEGQKSYAVNQARREINLKYGHGWRNVI